MTHDGGDDHPSAGDHSHGPHRSRVGFADVDFARFPFYGRYFAWIEEAWEAYLHDCGIWYSDMVGRRGIGLPVTAIECRYLRPLSLDDQFQVPIRVTALDRRGIRADFRFLRCDDGAVATEGSMVRRFVDMSRSRGTDIGDDLYRRFETLQHHLSDWPVAGAVVDRAQP